MTRFVVGLGISQTVSWAALIYTITVLARPMADDLGVSITFVFGAFSLSLVVSGLVGPRVGATIDRRGGRTVLVWGALIAAVSLAMLAVAPNGAVFVLAWMLVGVARAMTLYEVAFATLSQHVGSAFRKAVTTVTLFGGLAGTVAFPLCLLGLDTVGWRGTIAGFALAELLIVLPLHLVCIPAGAGTPHRKPEGEDSSRDADAVPRAAGPRLGALTLSFAFTAFITSAVAAHVVGMLQATGLSAGAAVGVASLIGPMQVAGRLAEFAIGRRLSAVATGAATLVLMIVSFATLGIAGAYLAGAIAFAALYGCANGVQTIVRGTVPAELFGRHGYGTLMGRLALWSFIARAIAPLALPLIASLGPAFDFPVALLAAMALLSLLAYAIAVRRLR